MEVGGSSGFFETGIGMRGSFSGRDESADAPASMSESLLRGDRVSVFSNAVEYSRVERVSRVSLPGNRNQPL